MTTKSFIKIQNVPKIEAGSILVSQPFGKEEILERVVIMIIEHNSSGTTGILLNKQSNLKISDALSFLDINKPLYYGGPSDTKIISYLHSNRKIPDSIYLGNGLFWGGSFKVLTEMITYNHIEFNELNFFAGFIHWVSGQLAEEITINKWWICKMTAPDLFSTQIEELWAGCLANTGHIYSLFAHIPDPSIN